MAGKKLCSLFKNGCLKEDPKKYKSLVKDARYVCKKCGRAAADSKHLCKSAKV
jgi:transposase-like protein